MEEQKISPKEFFEKRQKERLEKEGTYEFKKINLNKLSRSLTRKNDVKLIGYSMLTKGQWKILGFFRRTDNKKITPKYYYDSQLRASRTYDMENFEIMYAKGVLERDKEGHYWVADDYLHMMRTGLEVIEVQNKNYCEQEGIEGSLYMDDFYARKNLEEREI